MSNCTCGQYVCAWCRREIAREFPASPVLASDRREPAPTALDEAREEFAAVKVIHEDDPRLEARDEAPEDDD